MRIECKDQSKFFVMQKISWQIGDMAANPVRLVESMTEMIIEERMWFTALNVSGNSVSISGIALDERTIADFMKRLETKGGYANVTLKSLQRKEIKGKSLKLKGFSLSMNMPVSKSATEKNKAGKTKKS